MAVNCEREKVSKKQLLPALVRKHTCRSAPAGCLAPSLKKSKVAPRNPTPVVEVVSLAGEGGMGSLVWLRLGRA